MLNAVHSHGACANTGYYESPSGEYHAMTCQLRHLLEYCWLWSLSITFWHENEKPLCKALLFVCAPPDVAALFVPRLLCHRFC
jgi:hypothetical protein